MPCREPMTVSPALMTVLLAGAFLAGKVAVLALDAAGDGIQRCRRRVVSVPKGRVTVSMAYEPDGAGPQTAACVRSERLLPTLKRHPPI